jgi:penicillin-binding protein 2
MPQLVRAVETSDGAIVQDFPPRVRHKANVRPEDLDRVDDALYGVVNDPPPHEGTAYPVRDATLDVAGKSGTAQTGYVASKDTDARTAAYNSQNHAWFVAFSPSKNPEIAVVVLIEHGGSGPTVAAPLAMQMIRDYDRLQAARAGRPLPKAALAPKMHEPPAVHAPIHASTHVSTGAPP